MNPRYFSYDNRPSPTTLTHFIFDGWERQDIAEKFHHSIEFLAEEAAAGRHEPTLRDTGIFFIHGLADEIDDTGLPIGSVLEVPFIPNVITPEGIEEWLKKAGILAHRDEPFLIEKPTRKLRTA